MAKRIILIIVAILTFAVPMSIEAKKKGKAKVQFEEYSFDFGNVNEAGGIVSHEFTFTNTGDGTLLIIDANATCGCTSPEYPKNPIAPGKSGKIKVSYNPAGRPGPIDRTITVKTNGSPKKIRLKINGNVIPKTATK